MKCPVDGAQLVMTDRAGVEIDYCPECRGVWLDRGELDKIIDRSASEAAYAAPDRGYEDHGRDDRAYHGASRKKKKRGGFLEEIFDF